MVRAAKQLEKRWAEAESITQNPEKMSAFLQDVERRALATISANLGYTHESMDWTLWYMEMRTEFITPRNPAENVLPSDFDYADYLAACLTDTLAEIVEVPLTTWLQMEVGAIIMYFVLVATHSDPMINYYITMVIIWGNLMLMYVLKSKLEWIKSQLLAFKPGSAPHHWFCGHWFLAINSDAEMEPLVEEKSVPMQTYGGTNATPTAGVQSTRPQPPFLLSAPVVERSGIGQYMLGDLPNLHEQLFWADRKGPQYIESYTRLCLLFLAVYIPMLGKQCYSMSQDFRNVDWHLAIKVVLGLVPWIWSFKALTDICSLLEVCSVETMKRKPVMDKVKSSQLSKKVVKLFKVLHNLRVYAQINADTQSIDNGEVDLSEMDPTWKADIEQIFRTYDVDNSGSLDADEVRRFLHSLGQNATQEKARALCTALDKDGNGQITCPEFVSWMYVQHMHQTSEPPKESLADVAHGMFRLFDDDNSGEIQRSEMGAALVRFGLQMSEDELNLLMCELDPNGDGNISYHEFHELLERHNFCT